MNFARQIELIVGRLPFELEVPRASSIVIKAILQLGLLAVVTTLCVTAPLTGALAASDTKRVSSQLLLNAISRVRMDTTTSGRSEAAKNIADMVSNANLKKVDDATLHELASLLDSPDEMVRFWVALALGNFGKRATFAIPKLLELLPAADCERVSLNSSSAIRGALPRIGKKAPPYPDCSQRLRTP